MNDEEFEVLKAMEINGGGFIKALVECFYKADQSNFQKLKNAFPEYWEKYRKVSKLKA